MKSRFSVNVGTLPPMAVGFGLFVCALLKFIGEAWGYGLFLAAILILGLGVATFSLFVFSHKFDTAVLGRLWKALLKWGAWTYVWGVAALSGFFIHETLAGDMELHWMLFGPAALASIVAVDWGLYKLLVVNNLPTWRRFGHLVTREKSDPAAMRQTFIDDVVLHRSLLSVSGFRWLRHTLIFWGFTAMFALELFAVLVREAWPAFGGEDIWENTTHPIRLTFDFGYEFTGAMVLLGCILALIWRVMVNGKPEQKFADTPTTIFLLFVVCSGFVLEAQRLATLTPDALYWLSFIGYAMVPLVPDGGFSANTSQALWYIHVFGSCAFIAYVPAKRLIHSCATPVGRMMNAQRGLLAEKRRSTLVGLMSNSDLK